MRRPLALRGHTDKVTCLTYDERTGFVFSGSWDNTIRGWRIDAGSSNRAITNNLVFTGHTSSVYAVAVDGNWLISGSFDDSVRLWNLSAYMCDRCDDSVPKSSKRESIGLQWESREPNIVCSSSVTKFKDSVWSLCLEHNKSGSGPTQVHTFAHTSDGVIPFLKW